MKIQKIIIGLIIALGSFCAPVFANTYYVSHSGSNSNSGISDAQAFATLQHAADLVQAGDTVIVRQGSYVGMNLFGIAGGTSSKPIQFLADPNVVITTVSQEGVNANLAEINIENTGGYIVIQGFTIQADGSEQRAGIRVASSNHCQILNNKITNAYIGIFVSNSQYSLLQSNICGNSTDQHGIYMSGDQYFTVRKNELYGNNWDGLHINWAAGGPNTTSTHGLIEDNYIHDNNLSGIDASAVNNSVFQNNIILNNNKHGITLHNLDQSADTPPVQQNIFVNNTIIVPDGDQTFAVQMAAGGNTDNTFLNNILYGNPTGYNRGSFGLGETPHGLVSDYNVVVDNFSLDITNGYSQSDFAQWNSATGQDTHSVVVVDDSRLFKSLAQNDFHLIAGSPALAAGTSLNAPGIDYDGNVRYADKMDIGAFQLSTGTQPMSSGSAQPPSTTPPSNSGGLSGNSTTGSSAGASNSAQLTPQASSAKGCSLQLDSNVSEFSEFRILALLSLAGFAAALIRRRYRSAEPRSALSE